MFFAGWCNGLSQRVCITHKQISSNLECRGDGGGHGGGMSCAKHIFGVGMPGME